MKKVAVCSLFSSMEHKIGRFRDRLDWDYPQSHLVHVCIEGDSVDNTWKWLGSIKGLNIARQKHDFGSPPFASVDTPARMERMSVLGNEALELALEQEPDYILWLESDVRPPPWLLSRLLSHGKEVVAGFPMMGWLFYDTWAFRKGDSDKLLGPSGVRGAFQHNYPYHPAYTPGEIFEVDSVGTVMLIDADLIRAGARFSKTDCIVGLCRQLKDLGASIWVDPVAIVEHDYRP